MTNLVSLTLEGVSYQLPDGRTLFANLTEQFGTQSTGLVGRNGIGKSILARILAGELAPTTGKYACPGRVHYLPQQISIRAGQTVAGLAGVQGVMEALKRIALGSCAPADFDTIGDRWDIHQQLEQQLANHRLSHLNADTPAIQLSGGEAMRVSLIGAFLAAADFLILDEPTNHLDQENRHALLEQLQRWQNGLVVISHDRALLETMGRIVELSAQGLRSYGGGYSFYAQAKAAEQENAVEQLQQRKAERKREDRALRAQREKLEQRQAKGHKQAADANQAKILLGLQKNRSESSSGKLRLKQDAAHEELSARVREAAGQVDEDVPVVVYAPETGQAIPSKIAALDRVVLPFVAGPAREVELSLHKAQRIGVIGPNGSGKSTLLRVIAGIIAPASGNCETFVKTAYLDQHLATLAPDKTILEQLLALNNVLGESALRTRLAQLGLNAERVLLPAHLLSGGERLKAALACALYADQPAQLLLLDEPGNHLDLASIQALETMLRQYRGAFVVVSHDPAFLENIALTDRLEVAQSGWAMEQW